MSVAGLVLAAGESRRMGVPKMLLPVEGGTLLERSVRPLLQEGLDPVVVVLGHRAEEVRDGAGLPGDPALRIVVHEGWREGMASSLRRGLRACGEAPAVVVALGDQPGDGAVIRRLLEAHKGGAPLAVPVHEGRCVHPVLFARELWDELEAASGETGGRGVVRRHWARAARVPAGPVRDIDDPEDYRALLEGRASRADEGFEIPGGDGA